LLDKTLTTSRGQHGVHVEFWATPAHSHNESLAPGMLVSTSFCWSEQLAKAQQCILAAQQRQKHWADKKRQPAPVFKRGGLVLLSLKHLRLCPGFKVKFAPRYVRPFKVCASIGPKNLAYRLDLPDHAPMHNIFDTSASKPNHSDGSYQPPPLPELIDGELVIALRALALRVTMACTPMRPSSQTWEPEKHLANCADELKMFWPKLE
jgi:hypothetical protein